MATTESAIDHPLHSGEHPERHEHSDLQIGGLVITLVVGAIVIIITLIICYVMFWVFQTVSTHYDVRRTAINLNERIQSPEPRVQGIPGYHTNLPWQDLVQMKQITGDQLSHYGKTDDPNFVHIPIDQAMKDVVENGTLKSRSNNGGVSGAK